jgi:hypothetical protein
MKNQRCQPPADARKRKIKETLDHGKTLCKAEAPLDRNLGNLIQQDDYCGEQQPRR